KNKSKNNNNSIGAGGAACPSPTLPRQRGRELVEHAHASEIGQVAVKLLVRLPQKLSATTR
ncbi:MAG TPA: hypothetical protein VGD21_06035, partial [Lysobacter sp.]